MSSGFGLILHDAVTARTVSVVVAVALLYWLGYAINDYFDASLDAQDEHKGEENFFVRRAVPRPLLAWAALTIEGGVFAILGSFGREGIAIFAVANLAMWSYSAPPVRLKSRPGLDLLMHGLFVLTFPYLVSLLLIGAEWSPLDYVLLTLIFLTSVAGQLRQQIRDFEIDSRTDVNFTTTFGLHASIVALKAATVLSTGIFIAAVASGIIPLVVLPIAVLSLPALFDRVTARPAKRPPERLYRLSSLAAVAYSAILILTSLLY